MTRDEQWMRNVRFNAGSVDKDAREVASAKAYRNGTAVIFGAGASLKEVPADSLRKIAATCMTLVSPTVLPWFRRTVGCYPDYLVNVDCHEMLPRIVEEQLSDEMSPSMKVLLCPQVDNRWISLPIDIGWFLSLDQGKDGGLFSSDFSKTMVSLFPHIRTRIAQMGCVTNEMTWLVYAGMASLGINRIVLAGADYSYHKGFARVPMDGGDYPLCHDLDDPHPAMWGGTKTNIQMIEYARQLAIVQQAHDMPIFTMTPGIMSPFIQSISPKQVYRGSYVKPYSRAKTQRLCSEWISLYSKRVG